MARAALGVRVAVRVVELYAVVASALSLALPVKLFRQMGLPELAPAKAA